MQANNANVLTDKTGSALYGQEVAIQAEFSAVDDNSPSPLQPEYTIDAQSLAMLDRIHLSSDHDK